MFGGLEIKGTPSKDAGDNVDPAPEAAPSPGLSSFGFMNIGSPTIAAAAAPPSPVPAASGFSFLNTAAVPEPEPAPAASGFSFMMQDPVPPVESTPADSVGAVVPEEPPADPAPPPSSSGFDFMNSMAATAPVVAAEENTIIPTIVEDVPVAAPPAKSGFSFFSDTPALTPLGGDATEDVVPAAIHTRTNSVSSVSSALSAQTLPPAAAPGIAGVTFGTSSAKPRIKKKKIRSSKIGAGAHPAAHEPTPAVASTPAPAPPPAPAPVPAPAPAAAAETEAKSARDAALEATKKAEAFMQSKAIAEARSAVVPEDLGLQPTASTDEVLMAAREAAQQAKMMQKGNKGGFMGTFFKGFRANSTGSSSMANGSKHSVNSNTSGASTDKVAKEQQVRKQAVADRQLSQQQTNSEDDDDDDMIVVTTSVGGYKPEIPAAPEPSNYTPIASISETPPAPVFAPVTIPTSKPATTTTKTTTPSFTPVVIPTYGAIQTTTVAPPPAPVTKIRNTPKDIFEGHQEDFSRSVTATMKAVEDARSTQKGLLEERFVALAKDRFATREIEQLEELLQIAIDEEDYEQADELGQKLDAHKREKSEVASMLASNQVALKQMESQTTSLGDMVAACFQDLAVKLEELKQKELESEKQDDHEILTQYASISKQLSDEHERLQQDLKRLEREEGFVGEERKELEDAINEQTGEIESRKEKTTQQLSAVEAEIEELRRTLEAKQKEAAGLRTKMFGFEDSISKVRVKFSRQLNRVNNKEMTVKQNRREWEVENNLYQEQKEAHDLQVKTHSDTLLAHEELISTLESELKLSKEFSEIIPTQLEFLEEEDDENNEESPNDEGSLAQLKANVVKCEGAMDAAKKALKMATQEIQNLETEREKLAERIPQLETLKKSAAAGRDFKAAGKYSKEIKDATSRIQECEAELNGEARSKKTAAEEELAQLDSELVEAKKIADVKERESGEKRMATLAKKIEQLVEEKKGKCGDVASNGFSVKSVGARVLEGQILIWKAEGEELGSKYGGWDELTRSIDLGETSSSVEESSSTPQAVEEEEPVPEEPTVSLTPEQLRERLAKARELIARGAELEEKVQEAADRDDYEAAGEYQEALDTVNSEIEEMNITDEECELLAEDETPLEPAEEAEPALTDEERLGRAKELMVQQSELEEKIQDAAENEDFEAAEELQTTLDEITEALDKLNITELEKELLETEESAPMDDEPPSQDEEEGQEVVDEENDLPDDTNEEEKKESLEEEQESALDPEQMESNDEDTPEVTEENDCGEAEGEMSIEKEQIDDVEDDSVDPLEEDGLHEA